MYYSVSKFIIFYPVMITSTIIIILTLSDLLHSLCYVKKDFLLLPPYYYTGFRFKKYVIEIMK